MMWNLLRWPHVLSLAGLVLAVVLPTSPQAGRGRESFAVSPYLAVIADPGPCDVVITPANWASTLPLLNDAGHRVFCVDPGDYRACMRARGWCSAPEAD